MKKLSTILILILIISTLAVCLLACDTKISSGDNGIDDIEGKEDVTKYTISFIVDDSIYSTIVTSGNEIVALPNNPTKAGYSFSGWYLDKDVWSKSFSANSLVNEKLTSNINVYAKWQKNSEVTDEPEEPEDSSEYIIYFDYNGATNVSTYTTSKVVKSISVDDFAFDLVKENYNFRGWEYNGVIIYNELKEKVKDIILVDGMTFKASFVDKAKLTVVSNMPEAGIYSNTQETSYYSYLNVYAHPYQGYKFVGWFSYNNATNEYDLIATEEEYKFLMWTEDVVIQARFEIATFNLTIYSNNPDLGVVYDTALKTNFASDEYTVGHKYLSKVTITAITNTDTYRFLGWYEGNNLVTPNAVYTFDMVNYDCTYEARWNRFSITYDLNGGIDNSSNPSLYSVEDTVELNNPTKQYYDFVGWKYDENIISTISGSLGKHITLEAIWTPTIYSIIYTLNGGSVSGNPDTYTIESEDITLINPTKTGYTFAGWYNEDAKYTNDIWKTPMNITLTAKWTPTTYTISYTLNGGSVSGNPSTYTIESEDITLINPTKTGCTFVGWEGTDVIGPSKNVVIYAGSIDNRTYTANWQGNTYTITFDVNGGNVLESNTQQVTYDSTYTLPTPTRVGYTFAGWYNGSTKYTNGTWKMANNVTLTAKWIKVEFDASGNLVSFEYGEYPQTIKESSVTIDESSQDSRGYYLGSDGAYYAKVTAKPYTSGYTYSNGTTITSGNVYYFKVEPIKWKVLYNADGTYLVMSDLILDSQCYYKSTAERSGATDYQGNSTTSRVYANNYKYSDIRTFLNTTFINQAFTSEEQNIIKTTTVDNSASSNGASSNKYACEDTQDKIFLLSYKEVTNSSYGFSSNSDRYAKGTDYAKARGLFVCTTTGKDYTGNSFWWLRSPGYSYSYDALCVSYANGDSIYNIDVNRSGDNGVRPALNINL